MYFSKNKNKKKERKKITEWKFNSRVTVGTIYLVGVQIENRLNISSAVLDI